MMMIEPVFLIALLCSAKERGEERVEREPGKGRGVVSRCK